MARPRPSRPLMAVPRDQTQQPKPRLGDPADLRLETAATFPAKARPYLRDHEDHLVLQRLRRNKQLTPEDLGALEQMLLDSGAGTEQDIARATEEAHGLGLFIRSLVGLDRQAAMDAFAEFLTDTSYTAAQIRFIDLIVQHLTDNGVMEAARLRSHPSPTTPPKART